jgi:uncharacterized membrane protein YhaH (DUF805 family)
MAERWHVSINGAQQGPLTAEQVRVLAARGQLQPTDHIWKDGMSDWVTASSVRGLFPQQQPAAQRKVVPPPLSPFPVVAQGAAAQSVSPRASPATFSEAATRGFSRLFDFNGRSSRSEFWWFYLLLVLIWLPVCFVTVNAGVRVEAMQLLGYIYWAVLLSGVGARRLHDTNHSGWWQLLIITGIGGLVLLVWWCQKGTVGQNRFG